MYEMGQGVTQDDKEAVKWFRKAAKQGLTFRVNVTPEFLPALLAWDQKDYAMALRLSRPLAEQGDTWAQGLLGSMYRHGQGVPKDYAEAVKWFRKAAKQGNAGGQAMLSKMYGRGEGVLKDPVMSYVWMNVAAASGHPEIINTFNEFGDKDLAKLNASERKLALKLSKLCLDKPASCPEYSK